MTLFSRCSLFALLMVGCLWLPPSAGAQGIGPDNIDPGDATGIAPVGEKPHDEPDKPDPSAGDDAKDKALPPPPTLPGSHAQPSAVAPADRSAGDMEPTAALFDAINRGDTNGARDALARGADINARNVLGLTPIDLSVDLGRNDISFLLLSQRTADQDSSAIGARSIASSSAVVPKSHHQPALSSTVASGAASPSAGFLGFGGNRR